MIKICKACGVTFMPLKGTKTAYCSPSCAHRHIAKAQSLRMQAQTVNNLTEQLEAAKRRVTHATR